MTPVSSDVVGSLTWQAVAGICFFLGFAWLCSESRRKVRLLPVGLALLGQAGLATLILRTPPVQAAFLWLSEGILAVKAATLAGTGFVFGYVGGGALPFETNGNSTFVFGFQALPMVMVVSALAMLLFHWRILPAVVRVFSWVLRRSLHIGGALGVCAAAKVFLGQTEAPLLIRPYLSKLTRSEFFTVMTMGMATTSASVMVIYATILEGTVASPISHILTASIISVPAAIAVSRLMIPQEGPDTEGDLVAPYAFSGGMEAVAQGATDGMKLFLNIIAMVVVMLALVALGNAMLGHLSFDGAPITLQRLLGWLLSPVAWLMGVPWSEAQAAGQLIGTKVALNEVMAFIELSRVHAELSEHTRLIMAYTLCGFANFSSVGIQIGAFSTLVPERRAEVIGMGMRSLLAGTITSCMSATVVGIIS